MSGGRQIVGDLSVIDSQTLAARLEMRTCELKTGITENYETARGREKTETTGGSRSTSGTNLRAPAGGAVAETTSARSPAQARPPSLRRRRASPAAPGYGTSLRLYKYRQGGKKRNEFSSPGDRLTFSGNPPGVHIRNLLSTALLLPFFPNKIYIYHLYLYLYLYIRAPLSLRQVISENKSNYGHIR